MSFALICIATPSIDAQKRKTHAKTATQKPHTAKITQKSPSDKLANALNALAVELSSAKNQREMESALKYFDLNNLNLTDEDIVAPLTADEKTKVGESLINVFTVMANNVGGAQSADRLILLQNNIRNAVAKSNNLQEILINCGMNTFTTTTGRSSF